MHHRLLELAEAADAFSVVVLAEDVDDAIVLADGLGFAVVGSATGTSKRTSPWSLRPVTMPGSESGPSSGSRTSVLAASGSRA